MLHHRINTWLRKQKLKRLIDSNTTGQGCRSLLSTGEDNLQFYPNFALVSTLGDEPRPRFFSVEQIKWRPKKRSLSNMEHFFPRVQVKTKKKVFTKTGAHFFPNFSGSCAQMHTQTCSQKFAMGGLSWGSESGAPRRRNHGVWGRRPSALEKFAFFCKNNLILELF